MRQKSICFWLYQVLWTECFIILKLLKTLRNLHQIALEIGNDWNENPSSSNKTSTSLIQLRIIMRFWQQRRVLLEKVRLFTFDTTTNRFPPHASHQFVHAKDNLLGQVARSVAIIFRMTHTSDWSILLTIVAEELLFRNASDFSIYCHPDTTR